MGYSVLSPAVGGEASDRACTAGPPPAGDKISSYAAQLPAASISATSRARRARALLLAAAALFGTYSVIMRLLLGAPGEQLPVIAVTCIRFWIIAGCSGAMAAGKTAGGRAADVAAGADGTAGSAGARPGWLAFLSASAELAMYDLVGNLLSTEGLSRTDAIEAEILLSTMNLFVPVFCLCVGAIAGGRTWAGCLLAFVGVAVTAVLDNASGRRRLSAQTAAGPAALLLSAASYALGRVRLMPHLHAKHDSEALVFGRVAGMVVGSTALLAIDAACGGPSSGLDLRHLSMQQWGLLFLSCVLSGFFGCIAQFRGQRTLAAPTAQPILALQPVFAACWAALFLAEPLRPELGIGGGLILSGALLATSDPLAVTTAMTHPAAAAAEPVPVAEDTWLRAGAVSRPSNHERTSSEASHGPGTPRGGTGAVRWSGRSLRGAGLVRWGWRPLRAGGDGRASSCGSGAPLQAVPVAAAAGGGYG